MNNIQQIINEAAENALAKARKETNKTPTQAQIKAGNYKKGHVNILGFQITIENPKGSYRKGKDRNGKEWKTLMHNDYGYFVRTLGKDGDAIDVFIGPNLKSQKIFPVDQFVNGEFDETKVMLGFDSKEEAKAAYLSNYEKDWKGFKYITEVDVDTFKKWLYDGYRQRKPFAKYTRLTEGISESPDNCGPYDYRSMSSFAFMKINGEYWLSEPEQTHREMIAELIVNGHIPEEAAEDENLWGKTSGRYWENNNVLSFWETPIDDVFIMREVANFLSSELGIDVPHLLIDVWDINKIERDSLIPYRWFLNGTFDDLFDILISVTRYDNDALRVETTKGTFCMDFNGNILKNANDIEYRKVDESKKQRKNDEGKVVPEKCECGGDVVLQIHGEPVYVCKKCGKYFGTMPFSKKLNESADWGPVQDAWEEYSCADLLWEFVADKKAGRTAKHWDVIPAEQYHNLLRRYMENPAAARIPNITNKWIDEIVIKNALSIQYITELAGHSQGFPEEDCADVFGEGHGTDFGTWCDYLDDEGFFDWSVLPDGSSAWSDYGLEPIWRILSNYKYDTTSEEALILINRVLDVAHCRGDLASAFIQGGSHSCDYISNSINESIDIKKALKNLKKRRDPANIENWDSKMINESFNSPLLAKYAKEHGGLKVNRNGGLRQGVSAYHGGSKIDPSQVTDDMLYGEPYKIEWQNNPFYEKQFNNSIFFADGYAIMLKPFDLRNGDNIDVPEPRKKANRYGSGIGDTGDHDKSRGGFVGKGKDALSAPYNGFSVSDRAGEGQMRREAWNNNLRDIKYWEKKIKELENEIKNEPDFYRRNVLQKEIYDIKRKIANAQENVGEIKKYSRNLRGVAESKGHEPPKDVAAAIRKANRDADIEAHGKATDFRTTITKSPKAYSRKEKHKKPLTEEILRQIIRESIEEFYKGSQKEKAAYENACDCLYYGYGFKFWFERNSALLNSDAELAKKIWQQAKLDMSSED